MRAYRLLLRLYPASFRHEYGEEMRKILARRFRDTRGPLGRLVVWLDAALDVLANAPRVHAELLRQDVRYAMRTLARAPGFAITALLVTALGVGATVAAFSITDHVLIRPLPFKDPDRLVRLYHDQSHRGYSRMELSPANYRDWHRMATGFSSIGAFATTTAILESEAEPERVNGARVTFEVLPMLGVAPAQGRWFTDEDDREGAPATVILSDTLWRSSFGSDPAIVGRTILLTDEPHTVIGVMPRAFFFPRRDLEFWRPMRFGPRDFENRNDYYIYGIARLRDGVSVEEAWAQLRVVAAQLERQYPKENEKLGATIVDLRTDLSRQSRLLLIALFGASVCLLLIACTNLANLLLARALSRRREMAVRTALGAGRERLLRQMLTESVLLSVGGGALGVLVAMAATPLAARLVPNALPIAEVPLTNVRMLLFAAAVTIATGIAAGVVPAWRAGRVDAAALAEGARTGTGRRAERVRSFLMVAEVTASVVLLIGTGLLLRALWAVQRVDPGFDPRGVLTLRTTLPLPKYESVERRAQFYRRVLTEINALPGVDGAAYISYVPLGPMRGGIWPISLDGRAPEGAQRHTVSLRFVTPGFFSTLRVPLRAGRDVDERDSQESEFIAVVSDSFARQHFGNESPLGRRFFVAFQERTIVGVVGDIKVRGLERESEPQVYLPHQQVPDGGLIGYLPKDLVVRSTAAPEALIPAVRSIVSKVDPRQPVSDIALYTDVVEAETAPRTAQLRVLGAFAGVALLLAGIGLHGLLAFIVSARAREIGVRIALGAASRDIVRLVMGHGLLLASAGVLFGVALAYAAGRAMQGLLAGISPADAPAFVTACGLVLLVTIAGTLLPALRAMRIDPLQSIRVE
jgi:putative ABC transport system permease protein